MLKKGKLEKEKADMKTIIKQKVKHIKQLEDEIAPVDPIENDVQIVQSPPLLMNNESPGHRCNACNKEFANSPLVFRAGTAKNVSLS